MAKTIWVFMIVVGVVVGLFTGQIEAVAEAMIGSVGTAAEICIAMLGVNCMFMGIMQVAEVSGLAEALARRSQWLMGFLFPSLKKDDVALSYITMNVITNMFGMGNAATPFGLKAMEALQKRNPDKTTASDEMCMFALLNTASVQLLPLSIITLRAAAGAGSPADIALPCFIVTLVSAILAVLGGKLFRRAK